MDIVPMNKSMFYDMEAELGKEWELSLSKSMEAANIKEKEIAIQKKSNLFRWYSMDNSDLDLLVRKAHLLIQNENNNRSERLMNIVARFNAVLEHIFKTYMNEAINMKRKLTRKRVFSDNEDETPKKKIKITPEKKSHNTDYGPKAEEPEDEFMLKNKVEEVMNRLMVTDEEIYEIEKHTRGQFGNPVFEQERRNRLTASMFGRVMKRVIESDNALVEVKCLFAASKTVLERIAKDIINFIINLQIQGQLNITKKDTCFFVLYVSDQIELFIEKIKREEFWNKMLPVLTSFYKECVAPEIVRKNIDKGKRCKDPPYIQEATTAFQEKKAMREEIKGKGKE
ncbi:hypothetical protein NQ315_016769 [Exocentrus adspersus]|uniref:Uncharacterized protein n=1 Tax=Exocentrus adspersus TaxID=1586481 RepID=A0AAV8V6E2_9CUCU|nr:hypothetical protein NQ315_016769 [Exocentrus adspersus]